MNIRTDIMTGRLESHMKNKDDNWKYPIEYKGKIYPNKKALINNIKDEEIKSSHRDVFFADCADENI